MRLVPVRAEPWHILWHYANGRMPDFVNKQDGPVGWVRWSHRGIQPLDDIQIPEGQRRYVFSKKFVLKFDERFEDVVRATADPSRFGKTWITPELIDGLVRLNKLGYAHSFEAWDVATDQLAGGVWGLQIGGFITASSMFTRVANATKFAYGQALLHLKARGFSFVDTGMVPEHLVNYGSRYLPSWRFEEMLRGELNRPLTIADGLASPTLPGRLRCALGLARAVRGVGRRLGFSDVTA
jgi:leucyl/phenylalanyl-tRNA--protein transferase